MSKSEIALELTLAMLEKGMYIAQAHDNNAAANLSIKIHLRIFIGLTDTVNYI